MNVWYYAKEQQQHGPMSKEQLLDRATSGKLDREDLVWREGMADWKPAHSVPELFPTPPPLPTNDLDGEVSARKSESPSSNSTQRPSFTDKQVNIIRQLRQTMDQKGTAATLDRYRELKRNNRKDQFDEELLNAFGYELLDSDAIEEAIYIFELNVKEHPEASNPYDSLGEAYMLHGKDEEAIDNYTKSLELDPNNRGAAQTLEKLEEEKSRSQVDTPPHIGEPSKIEERAEGNEKTFTKSASPLTSTDSGAKQSSTANAPEGPEGVGGWLTLFCVALTILGPLTTIGRMSSNWEGAKPAFEYFPTLETAVTLENVMLGGIALYSLVVGIMIWSGRSEGKKLAQRYLLVRFGLFVSVEILLMLMLTDLPSNAFDAVVQATLRGMFGELVFFTIWYLYFKKSKRVAATYD